MNILATDKELDIIGYDMLGKLSEKTEYTIYIAVNPANRHRVKGKCIPLIIPEISSKFVWKVITKLRECVKKYQIDLVYSPGSSGLSNALFATIGTKARNIGYRGTQAKVKRGDFTYYLGILNPRVSHIICETEDISDYLSDGYVRPDRLSVILKPYDVEWVKEACLCPKQVEEIPEGAVTCVYIGSCKKRPFKGLTCLLQAFHQIEDKNVHLLFIGDYDQSDWELAKKGPSSGRIHFMGQQYDAVNYLPNRDIFILPSIRDASPRVVREAMACGLPCIVSDIPGARDLVVNGETGILFPAGDSESLALAINYLLAHKEERVLMGKAGKDRVETSFRVDDYVRNFEKLFQDVYNKG